LFELLEAPAWIAPPVAPSFGTELEGLPFLSFIDEFKLNLTYVCDWGDSNLAGKFVARDMLG